jgi:hydrogenase assembly chaperone HypC/HupF
VTRVTSNRDLGREGTDKHWVIAESLLSRRDTRHRQGCSSSQITPNGRAVVDAGELPCVLQIPGKILKIQEMSAMRAARVQFGGIVRQVSLSFVPEAGLGDYVMVHVGFAISRAPRD